MPIKSELYCVGIGVQAWWSCVRGSAGVRGDRRMCACVRAVLQSFALDVSDRVAARKAAHRDDVDEKKLELAVRFVEFFVDVELT
jgi:hypothetical protein